MSDIAIVCGAGIVSGKEIMALELVTGLRERDYIIEVVTSSWGAGAVPKTGARCVATTYRAATDERNLPRDVCSRTNDPADAPVPSSSVLSTRDRIDVHGVQPSEKSRDAGGKVRGRAADN